MSSTHSAFETLNAAQRDAVMHGEPEAAVEFKPRHCW